MTNKKYKLPILAIVFILLSSIIITANNVSFEVEKPIQNTENTFTNIENNLELEEIPTETIPFLEEITTSDDLTLLQPDGEENKSSSSSSFENISYSKEINVSKENQNYINIDEIINETEIINQTNNSHSIIDGEEINPSSSPSLSNKELNSENTIPEIVESNQPEETIKIKLYKDGKKEIEGKIPEDFKSEIKKTETDFSDSKKEVVVSSDEHLDLPLTVYTNIEETKNKENIQIYWQNEEKNIEITKYLDTNDNGLIDRIAWIVPHLSEQIFEITITPNTTDTSPEIVLEVEGLNGTLKNPISFTLNANYVNVTDLSCDLYVNGDLAQEINLDAEEIIDDADLPNDDYNWEIFCKNKEDETINETIKGVFTINENLFSITGLDSIYLLGQEINFNVNTPQNFAFEGTLKKPDNMLVEIYDQTTLGETLINQLGAYVLNVSHNYFETIQTLSKTFSILDADLTLDKTSINMGEEVKTIISLDSSINQIKKLKVDLGDGTINTDYFFNVYNTQNLEFKHNYTTKGNYNLKLTFESENKAFTVTSDTITVTDPADDNEAPDITLTFPKENSIIESETITFSYKVDDDEGIDNCIYELYKKQESWKELDYTTTDSSINLNEAVEVRLTAFEDGDYTWYVICEDTQGKEEEESQDFTIKTTKHEYEDEINEAEANLENFIEKQDNYNLETKEVLQDLGISEDLIYYKKRLKQIDQDLGTNIKFISNENLKQERTEETIKELEEIIKNIPRDIEIVDSIEFIKNSLPDLEKITTEYIEGKKIQLKSKEIKRLAEENYQVQEELGVTTKIKTVEITYKDRTEKITSVKKDLNLMDESYGTILEKIPNEIKEIEFKTQSQEVNKNLFEIKVENLENDELVYYIKEDVKLEKLKDAETVIFEEFPLTGLSITGYFSFNGSSKGNSTYYIIFLIFLAIALYFGKDIFKKLKMNFWKKEEDVRRILEYSQKAKNALEENNQEIAKEYYHKIKEIFNLTPEGFRNQIYPTIKKIRIGIDKRDMQNFIKEYEQAKTENRKEDTQRIYKNIQEQYKKLPIKYQQKVYEKIIKRGIDSFSF